MATATSSRWLHRLGLDRPELRAWALYDFANSAFVTVIVTAIFPIYFGSVAASGLPRATATARYAAATTIALLIVALLAPVLGAVADRAAAKKKLLGAFLALGVTATATLFFVQRGDWLLALVLFVVANVGLSSTFVFYDSLLPHIASADEIDRVSTAGYALGYLGGGLLLAVNLLWITKPSWFGIADDATAVRLSFLSVAFWWLGFSIPLFRRVPEPPRRLLAGERAEAGIVSATVSRLRATLRKLRGHKQALLLLVAFLVYNDGIGTIYRMAAVYGTEIGIPRGSMIAAILMVQFVGVPFSFLFGAMAGRLGAQRAVLLSLGVYTVVAIVAYRMTSAAHFFAIAVLVALVQGGSQALSRSLYASMIPRHLSSEFFAFFAVSEKVAGIAGPALFAATAAVTGSSRSAILSVIAFFVVGGLLLARVDVAEGRRAARETEAQAASEPA